MNLKKKTLSKEHRESLRKAALGNKFNYKGKKAGYRAIHIWVQNQLGKPRFCEECGNRELRHRQYHWANISGKYKRLLSDWKRLCVKCHMVFDKLKTNKQIS